MAITVGNTSTSGAAFTSLSHSHNNDTDFLVVCLSHSDSSNPTSATYGGVAMTEAVRAKDTASWFGSVYYTTSVIYYLADPPTGVNTISIGGGSARRQISAISLSGVDKVSPVRETNSTTIYSSGFTSFSGSISGSYLIDSISMADVDALGDPVPVAGQTVIGADHIPGTRAYYFGQSYEVSGGGSPTMSWSDFYDPLTATTSAEFVAAVPPTVLTGTAQQIFSTTAKVLNNNVTDAGSTSVTERGLVYATSTSPTTSDNKIVVAGTTGSYDADLTGLPDRTTQYARAYAINSIGTSYGSEISFTTDKNVAGTVINLDNPVTYS